jgi:hypothetical protein
MCTEKKLFEERERAALLIYEVSEHFMAVSGRRTDMWWIFFVCLDSRLTDNGLAIKFISAFFYDTKVT